jgi:hypothetical protein
VTRSCVFKNCIFWWYLLETCQTAHNKSVIKNILGHSACIQTANLVLSVRHILSSNLAQQYRFYLDYIVKRHVELHLNNYIYVTQLNIRLEIYLSIQQKDWKPLNQPPMKKQRLREPHLAGCYRFTHIIHSVFCLTTGPKSLPKTVPHIVRSRASSFKWQYPLLFLSSTSCFFFLVFLSLPSLPLSFLRLLALEGSFCVRCHGTSYVINKSVNLRLSFTIFLVHPLQAELIPS